MKRQNETYKLLRFEKSKRAGKKYDAVLKNKKTGGEKRVPFGATGYKNYGDKSGLGLYKGTGEEDRRARYRARHAGEGDDSNFPNAGYWAWHILW